MKTTPSYRKAPGAICCIPLFLPHGFNGNFERQTQPYPPDETYAYARLIEPERGDGDLIEVFNYIGPIPDSPACIVASGRMFRPIRIAMAFSKRRWRFVFRDPSYDRERDSDYANITFLLGTRRYGAHLWIGGRKVCDGVEYNPRKYQEWIVYLPTQIEQRIRKRLLAKQKREAEKPQP